MKKQLPWAFADIRRFKQNVHFTSGSKWRHFKTPIFRT